MLGVAQCVKKKKTVLEDKAAVVTEQVLSTDDAVPAEATKEEATVQNILPCFATAPVPHPSAPTAGRHLQTPGRTPESY